MPRVRVEALAAVVLVAIAVLTIVSPNWIEDLFNADPDAGSGAAEAAIVVICALAAAGLWIHRGVRVRRAARAGGNPEAKGISESGDQDAARDQ